MFAPKAARETETTASVIPYNNTKLQLRAEACWQFRALQTTTCKDELLSKAKCWPQAWRTLLQRQIAAALLFSVWSLGNLQVETIAMISRHKICCDQSKNKTAPGLKLCATPASREYMNNVISRLQILWERVGHPCPVEPLCLFLRPNEITDVRTSCALIPLEPQKLHTPSCCWGSPTKSGQQD